ncbi:alpha/beta-hydrolase [Apiospora rasikravindrae]|uniref:Alpha/beta-hydrolase n=1 Tax=Apiospora rasikravindrae TaxID=990691 RepID=A0ABR1RYW9_9PEZI
MDETPEIPGLRSMILPTKPDCPIKYTFTTLSASDEPPTETILIVFVNGLGLSQASWQPTLQLLQADLATSPSPLSPSASSSTRYTITATTYDRYAQGLSQPLAGAKPVPHDMLDAVADLSAFLTGLQSLHSKPPTRLFLASHSLGVPLARLFAEHHPGLVSALLILDSNMANNDFVSLGTCPPDTTLAQLRSARDFARSMFHPAAPNAENLDRSTLPALLPRSDGPVLIGNGRGKMLLRVTGHDPETFADESLKVWPRGLTERYVQPAWDEYNEGLLAIAGGDPTADGRRVVIAPHSGHFIQRNNPRFVADQVLELLKMLCGGGS